MTKFNSLHNSIQGTQKIIMYLNRSLPRLTAFSATFLPQSNQTEGYTLDRLQEQESTISCQKPLNNCSPSKHRTGYLKSNAGHTQSVPICQVWQSFNPFSYSYCKKDKAFSSRQEQVERFKLATGAKFSSTLFLLHQLFLISARCS